ncbi:hypothetical protein D3C84_717150 [compost metagenome]
MSIGLMIVLKRFFRRKETIKSLGMDDVFKGSGFSDVPPHIFNRYPAPLPPDKKFEAYQVRFLVSVEYLERLFQVFMQAGYVVDPELNTQVMMKSSQETAARKAMLFLNPAFAGVLVSFASNDLDVLEAMQCSIWIPSQPAESFPWLDPQSLGSLQGDVEYWWNHLWLPFWVSLSLKEQADFALEPEWREFMESHHISDDPVVAG